MHDGAHAHAMGAETLSAQVGQETGESVTLALVLTLVVRRYSCRRIAHREPCTMS